MLLAALKTGIHWASIIAGYYHPWATRSGAARARLMLLGVTVLSRFTAVCNLRPFGPHVLLLVGRWSGAATCEAARPIACSLALFSWGGKHSFSTPHHAASCGLELLCHVTLLMMPGWLALMAVIATVIAVRDSGCQLIAHHLVDTCCFAHPGNLPIQQMVKHKSTFGQLLFKTANPGRSTLARPAVSL